MLLIALRIFPVLQAQQSTAQPPHFPAACPSQSRFSSRLRRRKQTTWRAFRARGSTTTATAWRARSAHRRRMRYPPHPPRPPSPPLFSPYVFFECGTFWPCERSAGVAFPLPFYDPGITYSSPKNEQVRNATLPVSYSAPARSGNCVYQHK